MTASGIIGRYTITRSPLPTPSERSAPAKVATSSRSSAYVYVRFVSVTGES
jgi:hypothetical protein